MLIFFKELGYLYNADYIYNERDYERKGMLGLLQLDKYNTEVRS